MDNATAVRRGSDNSAGNEAAKEGLVAATDDVPEQYKTMHWG
jgi:hypothetical protein